MIGFVTVTPRPTRSGLHYHWVVIALGYSTYGMKGLDVFEALPRIRDLGYTAMEICVRSGWSTSPERFGDGLRQRLVSIFQDLGFPPPPLMDDLPICAESDDRL